MYRHKIHLLKHSKSVKHARNEEFQLIHDINNNIRIDFHPVRIYFHVSLIADRNTAACLSVKYIV